MKRLAIGLLVPLLAAPALAGEPKMLQGGTLCPVGQRASAATGGQCCWPGQSWSPAEGGCVGQPSECPAGMEVEGEACVRVMEVREGSRLVPRRAAHRCNRGEEATEATAGHCCWSGQSWSPTRLVCVGTPSRCPEGREVAGEECVVTRSPAPAPLPAPAAAPLASLPTDAPPSDDALPADLSNADVVRTMASLRPKVHACYAEHRTPGLATVALVVAGSGRIESASVAGRLAGTPTADCLVRAARSAKFPPFRGRARAVHYPVQLP